MKISMKDRYDYDLISQKEINIVGKIRFKHFDVSVLEIWFKEKKIRFNGKKIKICFFFVFEWFKKNEKIFINTVILWLLKKNWKNKIVFVLKTGTKPKITEFDRNV